MSAPTQADQERESFAEAALRLSGKTEEEARRTGAMDKADDQVESLFAPQYQTVNSAVHRAVWDDAVPLDLFASPPPPAQHACDAAMERCVAVIRRRRESNTLFDQRGKIAEDMLSELAQAGYW